MQENAFFVSRLWWKRVGATSFNAWTATAFSLAASVMLARLLGSDRYGSYIIALAVAAGIGRFLDVTLEEGVVFHGANQHRNGQFDAIVRSAWALDVALGLVGVTLLVAFAPQIVGFFEEGALDPKILRIASATVVAQIGLGTSGGVLLLGGRPDKRAAASLISSAAKLIGASAAAWAWGLEESLIATAAALAVGTIWLHRRAQKQLRDMPSGKTLIGALRTWAVRLLRFGLHSSIASSVVSANTMVVPVLVGRFLGSQEVALIAVAQFPTTLFALLSVPVRSAIYPEQARLVAARDYVTLRRSMRLYMGGSAGVALIIGIAMYMLLPFVLGILYGQEYVISGHLSRIVLVGAVSNLVFGWLKLVPVALGKPETRSFMAGFELLLYGATLYTFGRTLVGAAWAVSITLVMTGLVWVVVVHRLIRQAERPMSS